MVVDKIGQKQASLFFTLLLASSCVLNGAATSVLALGVGLFAVRVVGQGSMTLIAKTSVSKWFYKRRALAIAWMGIGFSAGSMIAPLLNAQLILSDSWQNAWFIWAVLLLVILLPLSQFLLVDNPPLVSLVNGRLLPQAHSGYIEDRDDVREELQHGSSENLLASVTSGHGGHGGHGSGNSMKPGSGPEVHTSLEDALRMPLFWKVAFCMTQPAIVNSAVIFHRLAALSSLNGVPLLTDVSSVSIIRNNGITGDVAPLMLSAKVRT